MKVPGTEAFNLLAVAVIVFCLTVDLMLFLRG